MKKVNYITFFVSVLAFFSVSVAQDLPRLFSGMISSVDVGSNTIVVRAEEKEMVFSILEETIIKTEYGEKVALNKLKNAMPVTVEYMKEGDTIRLLSIKVSSMPSGFGKIQKEKQKKGKK